MAGHPIDLSKDIRICLIEMRSDHVFILAPLATSRTTDFSVLKLQKGGKCSRKAPSEEQVGGNDNMEGNGGKRKTEGCGLQTDVGGHDGRS